MPPEYNTEHMGRRIKIAHTGQDVAGKGHSASPEPVRTREPTTVASTATKSMALFPCGPMPHQTVARKCTVTLQQSQQNPWIRLLQVCKSM